MIDRTTSYHSTREYTRAELRSMVESIEHDLESVRMFTQVRQVHPVLGVRTVRAEVFSVRFEDGYVMALVVDDEEGESFETTLLHRQVRQLAEWHRYH